jgi:hypothetical protein
MGDPETPDSPSKFPSKRLVDRLSLGIDATLTLDLKELRLPAPSLKALYDTCCSLADDSGTLPYLDFKDLPKSQQGTLFNSVIGALNDYRNDYYVSIHPGTGVPVGKVLNKGFKALVGRNLTLLPNELVLYINRDGQSPGGGVGVKLKTKYMFFEFGAHYLPPGYQWRQPGLSE